MADRERPDPTRYARLGGTEGRNLATIVLDRARWAHKGASGAPGCLQYSGRKEGLWPLCPGREGLGGEDRETVAMVGRTELMYKELSILKTVEQDRETVAGAGGDHTRVLVEERRG